ncbi:MAG: hypothetical protein GEU97_21725 [Actinophytocola sp.]|nr:hypothetical protein [Actinophytocola sp.]
MPDHDFPVCAVCGTQHSVDAVDAGVGADGQRIVACLGQCADQLPCPVCGVTPAATQPVGSGVVHDPSLPSPWERLCALAREADIEVCQLAPELSDHDVAGAVAINCDDNAGPPGLVALAEGLDDDTRTDVLAFGIAMFTTEHEQPPGDPVITFGIRRHRLPAAPSGVGHLAWHMLRTCGRLTSSATFDVVPLTHLLDRHDTDRRTSGGDP